MAGATLAFLGLGTMGGPMAMHLLRAGHRLRVWNRTPARAERFVAQHGGDLARSPADAASGAEGVLLCVGRDDDVRRVLVGPGGALEALPAGAIVVDHTTTSATLAREMAEHAAARGASFLDAPVSGGQSGAEQGVLTVMVGGDASAFARAEGWIAAYAKRVRRLGESGAGQLAKMVNQICIAGIVQGLAEGLHFARSAGLDAAAVVDVIAQGAAGSWQMTNRHASMLEGRYGHGFAVEWMRKDLGIVLDEARRNGASLPVTALVDALYAEVEAMGGARWDTSSLFARLERARR